ncbi:MAG: THUMP-like domain-containing protein [Candidatus Kapaibacteriota bacterium]
MNILSHDPQTFSNLLRTASEFLEQFAYAITPTIIEKLRRHCPDVNQDDISAIIDICIHTNKAKQHEWFQKLQPWFFTEQTLMQCSEPSFARYVVNKLNVKGHRFIESCTGAGMHSLSAMQQGASDIITHELDPFIAYLATVNATLHDYTLIPLIKDGALADPTSKDIFWADPSRRLDGKHRRSMTGYYSPDIDILIKKAEQSKRGGIKIAPGERFEGEYTREFLGIGRECREQILWFNTEFKDGTVTLIDKNKTYIPEKIEAIPTLIPFESISQYRYLLEPHAALIRGTLSANYAESSIAVFDRNIAYGITNDKQDEDWFAHFEILHAETFSRRKLQAFLESQGWNRNTEIKKRGFPMEPDELRKQLKFSSGEESGVIVLTRFNDEHVMILCKRA